MDGSSFERHELRPLDAPGIGPIDAPEPNPLDRADVGGPDETSIIADVGEEFADVGGDEEEAFELSGLDANDLDSADIEALSSEELAQMEIELAEELEQEEIRREIALAAAGDRVDQPFHTPETAKRDYKLREDEVLATEFNIAKMGISPEFDRTIHDKIFGALRDGGEVRIVKATDPGTGDIVEGRLAIIKSKPLDVERLSRNEGAERLGSG